MGTSAAAVQMNVRLGPDLKAAGDDALASIGFSPSDAVRALWRRASERGESLAKVRRLLDPSLSKPDGLDVSASDDVFLQQGWRIFDQGAASLGLSASAFEALSVDDDDLLEEALFDHWGELDVR